MPNCFASLLIVNSDFRIIALQTIQLHIICDLQLSRMALPKLKFHNKMFFGLDPDPLFGMPGRLCLNAV